MLLRWRDQSKEKKKGANQLEGEMEHSYCRNKRVEQEKSPIVSAASVSIREKKKKKEPDDEYNDERIDMGSNYC